MSSADGQRSAPAKERGISIVLAIFVLVVLSALGASMIRLISSGADSTAREVVSTRAFLAAESGAQRMLNQIFLGAGCADFSNWQPGGDGLSGCRIDVTCDAVTVDAINYYTLQSTGQCGPTDLPAVRIVEVQARD